MRWWLLLWLAALSACERAPEPAAEPAAGAKAAVAGKVDRSHAGKPAPDTIFEDPDGEPATLADFRGRPLLLNLWATWCAPCVAELPTLDSLAAREEGRLQVVTLSQDLDGREKVEAFFKKRGYRKLETWLDPQMKLMADLKVDTLPTTILYDAQGRELWRRAGEEDWTSERAAALLREGVSRGAAR